jgi:L-cystine transport system substrate-binding protein
MKRVTLVFIAVLIAAVAMSVSCRRSSDKGGSGSSAKPREIIIGAGSAYNPYWFLDEKGDLTGFEKAVLDEIDARHPEFTLKYQVSDFSNILLALESGKIDVAVHQYEFNIERNEKYLYGTVGYTTFPLYLLVREDDDTVHGFEDLTGKTLINTNTTNNGYYVSNNWNEAHGKPFKIIFQPTTALALADIEAKRADAMVTMVRNIENYKKEYNAKIKSGGVLISNSNAFYLFNKQTGKELQGIFDQALKELKDDGTLVKLSQQLLGGDFIAKD